MYHVKELYEKYQETLALSLLAGEEGLSRPVRVPEAHRPGLGLAGHLKEYVNQRILVLGSVEVSYLRDLEEEVRKERIQGILTTKTPTVVIAGRFSPPKELLQFCDENALPLLRTKMKTVEFLTRLTLLLNEDFSPNMTCHGTLVEAFGIGVLIQGDSSIGKSEAALGLIERGHRLISDDVVKIKLREGAYLEGSGPELTRHLLEIRGIGIINVAHLYGAVCVRDYKRVDLIVKLEAWDDKKFYDQVGLDQQFCDVLGKKVPFHILPVKPGRDVVLLIETITLNYRLKEMGFNSAKDFNVKLLEAIAKKQGQVGKSSESVL
jgi:HPr kinase/phosphorylase